MSTNGGGGGSHGFGVSGTKKKTSSSSKNKMSKSEARKMLSWPAQKAYHYDRMLAEMAESKQGKALTKEARTKRSDRQKELLFKDYHVKNTPDEERRFLIQHDPDYYNKLKKKAQKSSESKGYWVSQQNSSVRLK